MRRVELGAALLAGLATLACASGGQRGESGQRFRTVRAGVAYEMLRDSPEMVVLDVRPFEEYIAPAGHLERAVSAPLSELETIWPLLDLNHEDTVLIYCGDGGQLQSEAAAALIARGLRYVVQIHGGLAGWADHGFSVVVEDAPISRARPH